MAGKYDRKDRYYQKAKSEGYRSRASYKLLELDRRFKLFAKVNSVLDLGCAPGGWLQVVLQKVREKATVVGIDRLPCEGFTPEEQAGRSVAIICGDMTTQKSKEAVFNAVGGRVDLILSDMSPDVSGIRFRDDANARAVLDCVLNSAERFLKRGGTLVTKIFPGPDVEEGIPLLRSKFEKFHRVQLESTRKTSKEHYLVGRQYRGSNGK